MSKQKEIKTIVKELERQGWRIDQGKHIKAYHPQGGFISISRTPECPFAVKNIKGDIARLNRQNLAKQQQKQLVPA